MNCWRIELPATWDEYLATLSKSHRKQIRRLERDVFETGRAVLHTVAAAGRAAAGDRDPDRPAPAAPPPAGPAGLFRLAPVRGVPPGGHAAAAGQRAAPAPLAGAGRPAGGRRIPTGRRRRPLCVSRGRGSAGPRRGAGPADHAGHAPAGDRGGMPGRWTSSAATSPTRPISGACPRPSLALRVVPDRALARWRHHLWLAGRNVKHWVRANRRVRNCKRQTIPKSTNP